MSSHGRAPRSVENFRSRTGWPQRREPVRHIFGLHYAWRVLPRRLARLVAAAIAGVLLWLAFAPHDLWWTAPLSVAMFSGSVLRVRPRSGFLLGFVFGMAFFAPVLSWSGVYVGTFPWMALAVLQALYFAAMGTVIAVLQRRDVAPTLGAAAWVTQEWLRGTTPFGGFPWARLAFSQANAPWAPAVAWVSAPGLTFALALAGGVLTAVVTTAARRARTPERAGELRSHARTGAALAAAALALVGGCIITAPTEGSPMQVAAVQGNVPTAGLDFNAQRRAVLDNHAQATRRLAEDVTAGRSPRPDLVVWPENASDIDPTRNSDASEEIADALGRLQAPLVVGAVLSEPSPKVSNASMLYLPGQGLSARYVKQHPVPFGEYIPYRSFFRMFSKKVDLVRADFTAGRSVGLFNVPTRSGPAEVAPIICFEVAYDDLLRKPANRGAQMFLVQTNNATFGRTSESQQQLAISRLRALEYGRSIVHVSTVGVSALITPDGVAHERSSLFTQRVLEGRLPLRSHATMAQRLGRAPEVIATLVCVLALGGTWVGRRKSSAATDR